MKEMTRMPNIMRSRRATGDGRRATGKGFTLLEVIIVILILAVVAGTGVQLMINVTKASVLQYNRKEMSETARLALDRVIREIRRILNDTSVVIATSGAFQFINIDSENITFNTSGTTLQRIVDGTTNALADNVSSLTFTYYDSAGATIATPVVSPLATDIRRVEVDLTLSSGGTDYYSKAQVSPRRLR